jgi:hypothetical protein
VAVAFSVCVVPRAKEEFAGVIAIDTRVAGETLRVVDPEMEPEVATMDALPGASPLANPVPLMLAIPLAVELHPTVLVRFWVLLSV